MDLNSETGSSSWLTALLLHDQGFHLKISKNSGFTIWMEGGEYI